MNKSILLIGICFLLLAGCRQQQADLPRLVELDSLIAVAPDSAAALLEAIPADSLPTAADRAYHALLLTQAKYKADIHAYRLDTINLAVGYYADGHDKDKRTRSLLYKGCVMEELPQLDSAMYYYKYAEDMATQSGDTYHCGYALMRQAWMYQIQQSTNTNRIAADKYRQALDFFKELGDKDKQLDCMVELTSLLYPFNADSALAIAKYSENLCLQVGNRSAYYTLRTIKAQIMLDMMKYEDAKRLALDVLVHTDNSIDLNNSLMVASQSYCKLGMIDSAEYYFGNATPPKTYRDSVIFIRTLSELKQARQDMNGYLANSEHVINSVGTKEHLVAKNGLSAFEARVEKSIAKEKSLIQRERLTGLLICLIVLTAVLGYLAWRIQFKRKQAENMVQKLSKELNVLDNQLSQALSQHEQDLYDRVELKRELGQETATKSMLESKLQQESDSKRQLQKAFDNLKEHSRLLGEHPTLKLTEDWISMLVELVNKFNSKKQKDRTLKEIVNKEILTDELLRCLLQYIDAKYDGLATKVAAKGILTNRDLNVMCMHFCGFSNASIKAYMGTTDDHYVTTRKRFIAKAILNNSTDINDIISRFTFQESPLKTPS